VSRRRVRFGLMVIGQNSFFLSKVRLVVLVTARSIDLEMRNCTIELTLCCSFRHCIALGASRAQGR
jgi:hypothetical protein